MKAKTVIGFVSLLALILILVNLPSHTPPPEGSVLVRHIVSYCIGDATNDGTLELFAISGDGKIDTGERHGEFLLVCDTSAEADMDKLGYIPPEKIHYNIDLAGIKPLKVQLGDINGDGVNEVAICVYKTTKFHPVMAKYKGAPVYYSIGNFVFDKQIPDRTDEAMILQLIISKDGITSVNEFPIVIKDCQPHLADRQKSAQIETDMVQYSRQFE